MPYFKITYWNSDKAQKWRRNEALLALPKMQLLFVCSVKAADGLPIEGPAHVVFRSISVLVIKGRSSAVW